MCSGPRGEHSLRAGAARAAGTVQPPRPHAARPRGGRPEAKISRREVRGGGQGRREEPGRARAGLTRVVVVPAARTMSPPSWTCVGTCPESIARQHSALCRPAHRPHLPLAAVPSSASYRRLRPHCPPASPRVPAPDPSVCVIKPRPPRV